MRNLALADSYGVVRELPWLVSVGFFVFLGGGQCSEVRLDPFSPTLRPPNLPFAQFGPHFRALMKTIGAGHLSLKRALRKP